MAMDGVTIAALVQEINQTLKNTRVDKIYQPEHDEIHLLFRGFGQSHRLLLTANANIARVCFTQHAKPNPDTPPMFCMLLRKHLQGAKFLRAEQPGFERVIQLFFEGHNELGDVVIRCLTAELMGRHSNLILTDADGRISDSIKHVDFSVSSVRQVLPGLPYECPPSQGKRNPMACGIEDILAAMDAAQDGDPCARFFVDAFTGISPIIGREIVFQAFGDVDKKMGELPYSARLDLASAAFRLFSAVQNGDFHPCHAVDRQSGKHIDFTALPIGQYGNGADILPFNSMSAAAEAFYYERDQRERIAHRSASLNKLVSNNIERCAKKIVLQKKEWKDTEKKDKFKKYGDLITANLYQIQPGDKAVQVQDYYDETLPTITIPLDPTLTPSQNAQKNYAKYNKAKTAEVEIAKQLKAAAEELEYLESVEEALALARTEKDLLEIRDELAEQGYVRQTSGAKRKKQAVSQPLEFTTSDGFRLLIGRNNKQNDQLTLHSARNNDLWFHTKGFHGSHAVLKYEYEKDFPERSIIEAATLAAYYSKARSSSGVPVDYTEVRNVKKPSGSKPGMVIYDQYNTVYVTPSAELSEQLQANPAR